MYKKKLLTCAMCWALTVAMLTGCGKNSEGSQTSGNVTPEVTEPAEPLTYEPVFSAESGFYDASFMLEITCADENAKIYYTLDGSVPDETDTLYEEPINIYNKSADANVLSAITDINPSGDYVPTKRVDKCNVVRAVAVLSDGTVTGVTDATYFVGIDREEEYGNVPVVSMMVEYDYLFGYEDGIYVMGKTYDEWLAEDPGNKWAEGWQKKGNFSNKGREWEREATLQFFDSEGTEWFTQDAGIRIMGAASRGASQKSFRVTSREEYEAKTFEYELIPDNLRSDGTGNVEKYKSFLFRNGGNDNEFGRIRDPYLQSLVAHRSLETMQSTPVVVYLNGEYWGCYTLAEDYSDNYIKHNYGLDNENILIVKRGSVEDGNEEDIYLYDELFDTIVDLDMSVPENYEKACELLDMDSFAQYVAFNFYIHNQDTLFHGNNYSMWRCVVPDASSEVGDGKWRMLLYDTDYSTGIYDGGANYNKNNIKEIVNKKIDYNWKHHPNNLLISLLESEEFREKLILTMCDMRNVDFEKGRAKAMLDEMEEVYIKLIPGTLERFGPEWVLWGDMDDYFAMRMDEIEKFMNGRYDCYMNLMKNSFDLSDSVSVTIETSDSSAGHVQINTTSLEGLTSMTGEYFTEYPITLTAVPAAGKSFVGWECDGCVIEDVNAEMIEISLSGDCTIKAMFE